VIVEVGAIEDLGGIELAAAEGLPLAAVLLPGPQLWRDLRAVASRAGGRR
jgi:hypothetical protein